MNNYMLPTDDEFVETVARAIAHGRLFRDASNVVEQAMGVEVSKSEQIETAFDRIFEALWAGTTPTDLRNKDEYRQDARAAIAAINLKMLTTLP